MPQLLSPRAMRSHAPQQRRSTDKRKKKTRLSMLSYIYVSAWAALTKYHRLGGCLNHRFIPRQVADPGAGKAGCILRAFLVLCGRTAISLDLSFMDSWDREWDGAGRERESEPKCGRWSLPLLRSLIAAWGPNPHDLI